MKKVNLKQRLIENKVEKEIITQQAFKVRQWSQVFFYVISKLMNEKRNKALMATTWRHFNRNIFFHVTWQQETARPADRRSEVVRERPIRTQKIRNPWKARENLLVSVLPKSKALTILLRSLAVQLSHLWNRNSRNSSAKISDSPFLRVSDSGYSSGTPRSFHGTTCGQV